GEGALRNITVTGGTHPDDLAPMFGFESGSEMVKTLANLEKDRGTTNRKQYVKDLVTELANQKLSNEYGSIEDAMAEEAQKIALDANQVDILIDEMRHLAKQSGQMPFTKNQIEGQVEDIFGRMPVREAKYATFQRATYQSGTKAQVSLLKGDVQAAFKPALQRIRAAMGAKLAKRFESFQKAA